ncbi:DUF6895 family protein [Streptomyces caelestis]|uniref:DUF6895 family protein n=1 Tax=Streptomyces caelestis TaxID=36816 RepID=UPI003664CF9F
MTVSVARSAHRVASRALDWLGRFHTLATFPAGTTAELADPDSTYKPLGETALVASLVLREGVAGPRQAHTARKLLDFAWDQFRKGDLLYERQLRHPLMTDPLEIYAHFARTGYRHTDLEQLLTQLHSLRSTHAAELLPNRRLAVANAARITGLIDHEDWLALSSTTWLGATPEPWAIDWMTAYAVTHTVFHLTDWGARPGGLPAPLQAYLRTWLPVWVEVWREVAQWDLVGELLFVDACLDEPVCGAGPWEELAEVQHPDGLLPRDADPVPEGPIEAFTEHHHPTAVAVMAGTIALSRALNTPAPTR